MNTPAQQLLNGLHVIECRVIFEQYISQADCEVKKYFINLIQQSRSYVDTTAFPSVNTQTLNYLANELQDCDSIGFMRGLEGLDTYTLNWVYDLMIKLKNILKKCCCS